MKLLSSEQILGYLQYKENTCRATLAVLKQAGKTYRTRDVTRATAELNLLLDIRDAIIQPQKNLELHEAMIRFGNRPKVKGGKDMKFIAWFCHRCQMYFGEAELVGGNCPECGKSVIPQPMETTAD